MANLIDIRRRIRSVRNTQQITRAMKFVSAAKLKKAQARVFAARPYARKMLQLIQHLSARVPDRSHPLLAERDGNRTLLLIISSDKGLCGSFNTNVIKAAYAFRESSGDAEIALEVVGRKASDHFKKHDFNVLAYFIDRLSRADLALAEEIARPIMKMFAEGEFDRVYLLFNRFKSVVQQELTLEQLLPLSYPETKAGTSAAGEVDYIYEQPRQELYAALFPRHVITQVYHALIESVASEHGARMSAMDAATKNAAEMIDRLILYRNRVRQASITRELIEIVSGASAL